MARHYSKYDLYEASVQDPEGELQFFRKLYKKAFGKTPRVFREDFCSTFLNSITWIKSNKKNIAYAVDMNPEPLEYSCNHHVPQLTQDQQDRLFVFQKNVLDVKTPPADLITVSNFSICFLKKRKELLHYFKSCHKTLKSKGMVVFDILGGEELPHEQEDTTPFKLKDGKKATYYWEHAFYNPITSEAKFFIHYKVQGEKKRKRVFRYDWRIWSLPELKDVLKEAGFAAVDMYWEGDEDRGTGGNGIFQKVEKAESCPIWLAYVVGIKK